MSEKSDPYKELAAEGYAPAPDKLVSAFSNSHWGYRFLRPHGARSWLLMYTQSGLGCLRQPKGQWSARAGDTFLLAPDAYSDYGVAPAQPGAPSGTPHWKFHWVHFQTRQAWHAWMKWPEVGNGLYHVAVRSLPTRKRLDTSFRRLQADLQLDDEIGLDLARSAIEEIILLLHRETGARRRALDPRVLAVQERIQASPELAFSVESLSQSVHLSPSRFSHLFKEQTRLSIMQFVIAARIQRAKSLLAYTQQRISEIATTVGFDSPFYFSRQFRRTVGETPRTYRHRLQSDQGHPRPD